MILYQGHLLMRDSDRLTFENRLREALKYIETNHPGYRGYMVTSMGIDVMNCTENQIPNLKDMAPLYIQAHA